MQKVAVVFFNLGGPDSRESIEPFLFNFFIDPNIIRLPYPFRWGLAKLISKRRAKREAGESYGELGDKSPLLKNTQAQADALEELLNKDGDVEFKTFVSMRYWHPMAGETVRDVEIYNPDKIVFLPLYPQYSTTTTRSSLEVWNRQAKVAGLRNDKSMIGCYYLNDGFIAASAANIKTKLAEAKKKGHENPRILFSAHGLPKSVIRDGDPYQWQCEQTAEKIAAILGLGKSDWQICYQSKVGPMKWIGPSLDEALKKAAKDKKAVVVYPHAFTQEHVETLVELDVEYKDMAEKLGLPGYYRAETVGTHPDFIAGLQKLVLEQLNRKGISSETGGCLCPENFRRCCMRSLNV